MAQASKTFRVFVSSTFSDLKAERNALQKYVFPRLRELCQRHGCRFQAIDLRWGVSEEAALDQQTMKICLKEIARCQEVTPRPNFIVLLGDRYGWRPLPAEIPADEFATIERQVTSDADFALLERSYRLDENALYRHAPEDTPVGLYCLQRRDLSYRNGATNQEKEVAREAEAAEWRQVESHLRRILLGAVASLDLRDGELAKYHASATEQEIMRGAMNVADANYHVSCFFRSLRSANERPFGEDLSRDDAIQDFIDLDDDGSLDNAANDKLRDLQARLREHLGKNVHEYHAQWLGSGVGVSHSPITLDHIGTLPPDLDECLKLVEDEQALSLLCTDVWRRLARAILEQIAQIESVSPVQREKEEHEKFGEKRAKHFRGRARYLNAIQQYVNASDPSPFALWGESGSGKSALLARAVEQIHDTNPNGELMVRFVGATPQSSDVRALLESLCHQISGLYAAEQETIPSDYNGLVREFPKLLALATAQKPLVLVLDALDQLSDAEHGRNLVWLPTKLPENVRLIVSTIPGECLKVLQRRLPSDNLLCLGAMPEGEGSEVLDLWLRDAGRTLQDDLHNDQRGEVLSKFSVNGLPLYLKLAFEEARLWHSYDGVSPLAADVPGIISNLFERLSDEANHGSVIVSRSLGYLAAARNGLTEDEILEVLWNDEDVKSDFKRRSRPKSPEVDALPVVVWSRLYLDLEPYLTERIADATNLMAFYHRQVGEVVAQTFLAGETKRAQHLALAKFFASQDYFLEAAPMRRKHSLSLQPASRPANLRKASELAFQLIGAGQWERLETLLTELLFLEAKAEAGMVFDLANDFRAYVKAIPSDQLRHRILGLIEEAIRSDVHFIARHPTTLFQCMWNSCWWYDTPSAALHYGLRSGNQTLVAPWDQPGEKLCDLLEQWRAEKEAATPGFPWIRSHRPPPLHLGTGREVTLAGHGSSVWNIAFSPDGTLLASGMHDGSVRIWDITNGAEIRRLINPSHGNHSIEQVRFSPNGQFIAAVCRDNALLVWDISSGAQIHRLEGHEGRDGDVRSLAFSPDGDVLASGSMDQTVRIWDTASGQQLLRVRRKAGRIFSVAFASDGRQVAVAGDEWLTLLDARTGQELWCQQATERVGVSKNVMKGHFLSLAYSSHDNQLVTAQGFCTLDRWDPSTGQQLASWKIPPLRALAREVWFSADGSWAAVPTEDRGVSIHCTNTGEQRCRLPSHEADVRSVAISPMGDRIASATWPVIFVWDMQKDLQMRELIDHRSSVVTIAASPDGRFLASGARRDNRQPESVRIWDMGSGTPVREITGFPPELRSLAFSPTAEQLAIAGASEVWLGNAITGEELLRIQERDYTTAAVVSADGTLVASGRPMGDIVIWNARTGLAVRRLRGHQNSVTYLSFSPDMTRIASISHSAVRIWNLENGGEEISRLVDQVAKAISPDFCRLAILNHDRCQVLDLLTGAAQLELRGHLDSITSVAFSPDSAWLATGGRDKTLRIWNTRDGAERLCLVGHPGRVTKIAFSGDGSRIVSVSWNVESGLTVTICVWDAASGAELGRLEVDPQSNPAFASMSPDGLRVVVSTSGTLGVWDWTTSKQLVALEGQAANGHFSYLGFGGTSDILMSCDVTGTVRQWDLAKGREIAAIEDPDSTIESIAFATSGEQLVGGMRDGTIRVWEAATGNELRRSIRPSDQLLPTALTRNVRSLVVSADDTRIAGSTGNTVRIWDSATAIEMFCLHGHQFFSAGNVAFSEDGSLVYCESLSDGAVLVWDLITGQYAGFFQQRPGESAIMGNLICSSWSSSSETTMTSGDPQKPLAWFPPDFHRVSRPRFGWTWAAITQTGTHVFILSLEGWAALGKSPMADFGDFS